MDALPHEPQAVPQNAERQTRLRKQKLTAPLTGGRRVVTVGVDSTMDAYLAAIGDLLRRGTAAKKQGIELPTFLNILRDQAMR